MEKNFENVVFLFPDESGLWLCQVVATSVVHWFSLKHQKILVEVEHGINSFLSSFKPLSVELPRLSDMNDNFPLISMDV